MKKSIVLLLMFVSLFNVALCVNTQAAPVYDYSSFVGEWHKIDPDQLWGDVTFNILEVTDNYIIRFSNDGGAIREEVISNNKVKWTEEWHDGMMGLTLTFYDDHIHLQYSRYSHEWYSEIIFVSSTAKPKKNNECSVVVNGKSIMFDQPPIIVDGRTLVPIRAVIEEMGGNVDWDASTKTVTLSLGTNIIKLTIGSATAYLNDVAETLDVAPQIINGRTLLPIRFIAEGFDFDVNWDGDNKIVNIITKTGEALDYELLDCIGKTKTEIAEKYGNITDSSYWMGGKYYMHSNMKTQMFYENADNVYNYEIHDDAPSDAKCIQLCVNLNELIKTSDSEYYSVDDLQKFFGEYELENDLENEMFPCCYYRFEFENYVVYIESDYLNPILEYAYITKK